MTALPVLEFCDVGVSYGRRPILRGVTFALHRGQLVGLVGENGAGKSTLLKAAVGLIGPQTGGVRVNGKIGYCPQEPLVFEGLTVRENLRYFASAYRLAHWEPVASAILERLRFRGNRDAVVATLSAGTRQKINLTIALLHQPELLFLDEPYTGFDWETYLSFWDLAADLRAQGTAILMASHLLHDRPRFDAVFALSSGELRCA